MMASRTHENGHRPGIAGELIAVITLPLQSLGARKDVYPVRPTLKASRLFRGRLCVYPGAGYRRRIVQPVHMSGSSR
jgi:hypothetical protein